MALEFGEYKFNTFRSDKNNDWAIQIWKKNHADRNADGTQTLYPPNAAAREFSSVAGFNQWNNAANWSYSSSYGGSAKHTAGNNASLIYDTDLNLLESGVEYRVLISIQGRTNGAVIVKLGGVSGPTLTLNQAHSFEVVAGGGALQIVCTSQFDGYIQDIQVLKYFSPSERFETSGDGFTIKWNGSGGTRNRTFLGSECVVNYLVQNDNDEAFLKESLSGGTNAFFIRIYKSVDLFWFGWVQPAFDQIENVSYPYTYKLTATDSYGFYAKSEKKVFSSIGDQLSAHSIKNIFFDFLEDMKIIDLGTSGHNHSPAPEDAYIMRTILDWWQPNDYSATANAASTYYVKKGFVIPATNSDEIALAGMINHAAIEYNPVDILNGVLKAFGMVGFLADGKYNFVQENSFAADPNGVINVWDYRQNPSNNEIQVSYLPRLDLSLVTNDLLAGSSFTFEPAYKKVFVNHIAGFSNFDIPSGTDLTNEFDAGSIQSQQDGFLTLDFYAKHTERLLKSNFNFVNNYSGWKLIDGSVTSVGVLTVKITDGSTTKYLRSLPNDTQLTWTTAPTSITISRGYDAPAQMDLPVNNSTFCVGLVFNSVPNNSFGGSTGPTQVSGSTISNYVTYTTDFKINAQVADPEMSGQISLEFDVTNDYYQAKVTNTGSANNPNFSWEYADINDPSPVNSSTECENITLIPTEQNLVFDADVSDGIIYTASQSTHEAVETFDLGDVALGQSAANQLYSINYLDGNVFKAITGLQRGNPSPATPLNASQLLVNEFLQIQSQPLEILQGTIKSSGISPLNTIKYDYNNDGNFKYYRFLGGTFKAASDELSGEWFKINEDIPPVIVVEDTTEYDPVDPTTGGPADGGRPANNSALFQETIKSNALGFTTTQINHQTTYAKVNFVLRGQIYDNQKLLLTLPDGSNPLTLTADGGAAAGATNADVDSFTAGRKYPIGSIISAVSYDLSNVITGGGGGGVTQIVAGTNVSISPTGGTGAVTINSSGGSASPAGSNTEVQFNNNGAFGADSDFTYDSTDNALSVTGHFEGGNIGYRTKWDTTANKLLYYFNPSDFNLSSNSNVNIYTRTLAGDVIANTYDSRANDIMGVFNLPVGYKITSVILYANVNKVFVLEKGSVTNNTINSIGSAGTTNSNLNLNTPETIDVRKYYVVRMEVTAVQDAIYGGYFTLEKV